MPLLAFDVFFKAPEDPNAFSTLFAPANISPLVAYLSSESCTITGKVYDVRGGAISELAGWHDVRTIETDGPWDIDTIAANLS